jgi:trans-aconitate 2-methyltransferase
MLDLGCGTAALTAELHQRLHADETLAMDSSAEMLARAKVPTSIRLVQATIEDFEPRRQFDLVLASASLQWVPDHPRVFERIASWLRPGGQIAVQMPASAEGRMRTVARSIAARPPFASLLRGYELPHHVLTPEEYAWLLHRLRFPRARIRTETYGVEFASRASVSEWAEGSLLSEYRKLLGNDVFRTFADQYREEIESRLPDEQPFFHTFTRLVIWGASEQP